MLRLLPLGKRDWWLVQGGEGVSALGVLFPIRLGSTVFCVGSSGAVLTGLHWSHSGLAFGLFHGARFACRAWIVP